MSFAQTTVTLNSVADCYIDQNGSTTNYGGATNMQVTSWGPSYNRRMLIKFDLSSIPTTATINSAVLKLHETGTYGQTRAINLHHVTSSWVENTATWSNMASNYNSTVAASSSISWSGVFKIDTWTLTSEVQSIISSGTNNGWLLKDNTENGYGEFWQFGAKENTNSAYRPVLEITYTVPLTITINPSAPSICAGSSVSLTASGGTTYAWTPSTGLSSTTGATVTANPSATTTYTVTGTTGSNTGTQTVTVTVNSNPTISISPSTAAICSGGSIQLTASGANSYAWSPTTNLSSSTVANPTASPANTTTYTVTGTAANGCTATASRIVTVNSNPVPPTIANQTICQGQTATFDAGAGFSSYSWNTGATTRTITTGTAGTYTATVTNANGCSASGSATLTVNSLPNVLVSPSAATILNGQSIQLVASGANTYSWTNASSLSASNIANPVANPSVTTSYVVTGTDNNGCTDTATSVITVSANLLIQGDYATLVNRLDNNLFKVQGNDLLFVYDEQYEVAADAILNYVIYDYQNLPITNGSVNLISIKRGLNKCKLTNIHTKLGSSGVYIMEVSNNKNEKFYLRFSIQ